MGLECAWPLPDPLYSALADRLRTVLADPPTEARLRAMSEEADAGIRALEAQIRGSERRLRDLNADDTSSLTEMAAELRRVDTLRPELIELTSLQSELDRRARELRTEWLLRQTRSARPS